MARADAHVSGIPAMPFLLPSPHRLLCPGSMPGCFNVPTRRYSNGRVFVYCSGAVSPFVKQADAQRTSVARSEEHTSELQSLMRTSYAVFCLKTKKRKKRTNTRTRHRSTYK